MAAPLADPWLLRTIRVRSSSYPSMAVFDSTSFAYRYLSAHNDAFVALLNTLRQHDFTFPRIWPNVSHSVMLRNHGNALALVGQCASYTSLNGTCHLRCAVGLPMILLTFWPRRIYLRRAGTSTSAVSWIIRGTSLSYATSSAPCHPVLVLTRFCCNGLVSLSRRKLALSGSHVFPQDNVRPSFFCLWSEGKRLCICHRSGVVDKKSAYCTAKVRVMISQIFGPMFLLIIGKKWRCSLHKDDSGNQQTGHNSKRDLCKILTSAAL